MADPLRWALTQLVGKLRRLWLVDCRPGHLAESLRCRTGACQQCGKCCRLLFRCPFLRRDDTCRIYGIVRPASCSAFPIDERDLADVGGQCGFSFDRGLPVTEAAGPKGRTLFSPKTVHGLSLLLAMACASNATALSLALGAGVFLIGLAAAVWSKLALTRDTRLVTGGPYALCRHPFYLGSVLVDVGVCLMSGSLWLLAFCPLLIAVGYGHTVAQADARLRQSFPDGYGRFCRSTPAFFPLGGRILRGWRARVRWGNLLTEHIASRSLRHLCYPVLVLLAAATWAAPAHLLSPTNLALASVAVALRLASASVYTWAERGRQDRWDTPAVHALASHPGTAWLVPVLSAALMRKPEAE